MKHLAIAGAAASADLTQTHSNTLYARYWTLEAELDRAPSGIVGTVWWDERIREMRHIVRRLGR